MTTTGPSAAGRWSALQQPAPPQTSPHWFRLAPLRPQLPAQVTQHRQVLRGRVWHTLTTADGRHNFRLNAAAWSAVARCNGQHTVQQLWAAVQASHGNDAPTQGELLQMLSQLHAAGLLSFDRAPDFGDQGSPGAVAHLDQAAQDRPPPLPGRSQHLLAWRVSLGNPDALLARLAQLLRLQPGHAKGAAALGLVWLLLMAAVAAAAALQAGELTRPLHQLLATPGSWGLAWLAYPLMKLLHEMAHGLMARRHGAVVSDWGITWLMFLPVPYVDASAASALPLRRQRLAVSAAGIAVELTVAAVACTVALAVQPGALRDAALLVAYLALGSSLLVNANPLLRFDGYHMLCDALGLPNLAVRSSQHWLHQLRRHGLGQQQRSPIQAAPGEAMWLWVYAPAAMVMRAVVALAVVLWLGGVSHLLGQLALALFVWVLVLAPLARLLRQPPGRWRPAAFGKRGGLAGWPARLATAAALALPGCLLAAALWWPLPMASVAQGVLWMPESALVRAQASGFVARVLVADGQAVQPGDAVLTLHAPALQAQADNLQGRVEELQAQHLQALHNDGATATAADHALRAAQADLAHAQQRLEQLTVRAPTSGHIAIAQAADLPGRYIERGTLLAHVLTPDAGIVKLAIAQDDAARLPRYPTAVQVLAADNTSTPLAGRWLGAATGAHALLPSAALGSRSGGRLRTDPADATGRRPAQPVVLGDVQLQGVLPTTLGPRVGQRVGQRVLVRFEHGQAPLLTQAARSGQQLLLRHFNPSS